MSLEKIKMLEDRISEVMEYLKKLKREKADLEQNIQEKEIALKEAQQEIASLKRKDNEYDRMKDERGEVRSRIEKILDELKGVEGV